MSTQNLQPNNAYSDSGKILVAEDNLMNQKVIKALLQKEGYDVTLVSNGKEVLPLLAQHSFFCLILDYQMPEMDGFETLQVIRSHSDENIRKIMVIFLTAELNRDTLRQIEQFGVSQMLQKPIIPQKLTQAVALLKREPENIENQQNKDYTEYLRSITDGNAALMVELINIFLEEAPLAIENIKVFNSTKNYPALLKAIHKIRSNYKYVGMLKGEALLANLEKDVEQNHNPEKFSNRIQEIERITQNFLQVLTKEKMLLQQK